ncbi:hypothetical protein H4Q26_011979 [Puccinia striiformis f. sp. tritici PST-130]|nr:hypothetical protein H4Q26_011979 [Puccinia striiformis f. sp. tritici PST-130]
MNSKTDEGKMGMGGGTNATFKDDSGRLKHSLRRSISAEPLAFLEVSLGSEGAYEDMPEQGMGMGRGLPKPAAQIYNTLADKDGRSNSSAEAVRLDKWNSNPIFH